MPPEDADAFRAAFLAEIGPADSTADDAGDGAGDDEYQGTDDSDSATDDSGDEPGDTDDPGTPDGASEPDEPSDAATAPASDDQLAKAIAADDPELFLSALGDKAETLLGSKAHRALRLQAKELSKTRESLHKAANDLKSTYGDPAAVRAAASKGDHDGVLDGLERFFGTSAEKLLKFLHDGLEGRPARLEAAGKAKSEETAAAETARKEAEGRVRASIESTIKQSDAALLEGYPALSERVFSKLRDGLGRGIDTPAKALAAVKAELKAEHAALAKVFAAQPKPKAPAVRPPREPQATGREMTPEEFRREFILQHKREQRARAKKGAAK